MEILADAMPDKAAIPRSTDGMVDIQSLLRLLAEQVVNAIMDEEADQLCGDGANSRNGYRNRTLETCVGTLNLRIPKLRTGSFFPEDVLERYQRVDRALVAAVAEMYATGTSTRKVQRIAEKMGIERLGRDRVSAIAATLDAEIADLAEGPLDARAIPYIWLDATYVKCRRGGRVASTAVVTAIGCDESGWRRVLGVSVVDTESHESWLGFLRKLRDRGATGAELVVSDAHGGLVRAVGEVFQGAAWQRCAVHLMRDCMREAGSWQLRRRVGRIVSSVFRARDAATAVAMYHAACEMLEGCCPRRRGCSRRRSPTRSRTWTSRRRTGSACAPTTCRSAPTGKSSAARAWCRSSRRRVRCSGSWAPSCATRPRHGPARATSRRGRWPRCMTPRSEWVPRASTTGRSWRRRPGR